MTSSGSRSFISVLLVLAQITTMTGPLAAPAAALAQAAATSAPHTIRIESCGPCPQDANLSLGQLVLARRAPMDDGSPAGLGRTPPVSETETLVAARIEPHAAEASKESPVLAASTVAQNAATKKSLRWIWASSAALVGLFIAAYSYELSREKRAPRERPPSLPYFPDAP